MNLYSYLVYNFISAIYIYKTLINSYLKCVF